MFSENAKIVPVLVSTDISASTDLDAINMAYYSKATFVFLCGAVTGATTHTFKSGADASTKTTAVPFVHAMGGAAIGTAAAGSTVSCDVLAAFAATSSAAITSGTKMVVIEISASAMTAGEPWLTGTVANATDGDYAAVAILEPRYSKKSSDTALA
jgi:hypothetical protein